MCVYVVDVCIVPSCICTYMYMVICICVHLCMGLCVCICVCICMYIYITSLLSQCYACGILLLYIIFVYI